MKVSYDVRKSSWKEREYHEVTSLVVFTEWSKHYEKGDAIRAIIKITTNESVMKSQYPWHVQTVTFLKRYTRMTFIVIMRTLITICLREVHYANATFLYTESSRLISWNIYVSVHVLCGALSFRHSSEFDQKSLLDASEGRQRQRGFRGSQCSLDTLETRQWHPWQSFLQRQRAIRGSESAKERQRSLGSHESDWIVSKWWWHSRKSIQLLSEI